MKIKKLIAVVTCAVSVVTMAGCEFTDSVVEETKKDIEWTKENNAYTNGSGAGTESSETETNERAVGETASFSVDDGEMDVTVTDWGSVWSDYSEQNIIYFNVEFDNTGSTAITISPALFSVYSDDYSVELTYAESDVLQTSSLDGGRKAKGKIYAVVDSEQAGTIEVQLAKTVWILKDADGSDSSVSEGTDTGEFSDADIPENITADKEDLGNVAGMYWNYMDTSNIEFNLYSSPEDSAVGNVTVYYGDSSAYSGEIEKVATNVYYLGLDGADLYFSFYTETTGAEKALRMQFTINGSEEDWYYRTEEFES